MARLSAWVLQYIAADVSRRRYGDDENVPPKVRSNVRRQFKVAMTLEHAVRLVERYRRMYTRAAALLPRYLKPQPRHVACDWSHVRIPEFIAVIRRRYPGEPVAVVRAVTWYVIHYEYLR